MSESSQSSGKRGSGRRPRGAAQRSTRSWYVDLELWERGRNAVAHTRLIQGEAGSYAELVERALRRAVERLERRYNNGEPFPSGSLPSGPGWQSTTRKDER